MVHRVVDPGDVSKNSLVERMMTMVVRTIGKMARVLAVMNRLILNLMDMGVKMTSCLLIMNMGRRSPTKLKSGDDGHGY